jgi:hypothetical protein
MAADASAYAALGLEPGADGADIEQAYKKLIKQHHPDREGGDVVRAVEINRAYRELRASQQLKDPLELYDHIAEQRRSRLPWLALGGILCTAVAAGLMIQSPVMSGAAQPFGHRNPPPLPHKADDVMDEPLYTVAIDAAVRTALDLHRTSDEMALSAASAECNRRLRANPDLAQLDRCAAFDDAVVQLQDRDPFGDRGPFSELAVTSRQWSSASAISDDYLSIDGRLDKVRLRVELLLAPLIDPEPSAPPTMLRKGG